MWVLSPAWGRAAGRVLVEISTCACMFEGLLSEEPSRAAQRISLAPVLWAFKGGLSRL